MNKLMAALIAGLVCVAAAQAQDKKPAAPAAEKKMSAQQSRMGDCNKEAKEKKLAGDARKKFMSSCLKGGGAEAAPAAATAGKPTDQKSKMGYCNKEAGAKKLKGDERKKFMSACLKG